MEQLKNKKTLFTKKELLVVGGMIVLFTIVAAIISAILNPVANYVSFATIQANTSLIIPSLIFSLVSGVAISLIAIFIPLTDRKPNFKKTQYLVIMAILFILGLIAYQIIILGLDTFKSSFVLSTALAMLIYNIYLYLMLKMYIFDYIEDKGIFYEVVRFALVGVIAALFDLSTCYLFAIVILPSTWLPIAITIVSVSCGFIIGVIVNYLCSVYMVFKNTSDKDKSRTHTGRLLFLFLAFIGLLMGYGLQYLFYDYIGLGFVLTFVIRTLIVLVWNYFSRKRFIFK